MHGRRNVHPEAQNSGRSSCSGAMKGEGLRPFPLFSPDSNYAREPSRNE